jgi:hypothetical protein
VSLVIRTVSEILSIQSLESPEPETIFAEFSERHAVAMWERVSSFSRLSQTLPSSFFSAFSQAASNPPAVDGASSFFAMLAGSSQRVLGG